MSKVNKPYGFRPTSVGLFFCRSCKAFMKRNKACIFCGKTGNLTKEHLWPKWLDGHLLVSRDPAYIHRTFASERLEPFKLVRSQERQGPVTTKRLRVVCASCNNGWMSRLESSVKLPLLGLIRRDNLALNSQEALQTARWIALKTMVAEHDMSEAVLTLPEDRLALCEHGAIPTYFRIWIASHGLSSLTWYFRDSKTISVGLDGVIDPPVPPSVDRNIQLTAFAIGRLLVVCAAARVAALDPRLIDPEVGMVNIWPQSGCVDLAGLQPMNKEQVDRTLLALRRLTSGGRVSYGGPIPR
ncbi:hypothetical protein [Variovorax fucosicus]|uniref:hypothetical protein n=1 Tax=Variovorax fucosicus TaxID=3053517 RepID=UPI0025751FAB|nr:hypothetical protein [Variovorax sp. J22G47]MDM0056291.1 hypothetical protein [Variovorax sp. J22G47]